MLNSSIPFLHRTSSKTCTLSRRERLAGAGRRVEWHTHTARCGHRVARAGEAQRPAAADKLTFVFTTPPPLRSRKFRTTARPEQSALLYKATGQKNIGRRRPDLPSPPPVSPAAR